MPRQMRREFAGPIYYAMNRGCREESLTVRTDTCTEMDGGYVEALGRMPIFAQEITRYSTGVWSSRLRLYPEGFFEAWLPVPPLAEKRAIVGYIASATAKLDGLRAATERTIALLKERRAALVAAAVTGKITVPTRPASGKTGAPYEN